MPTTTAISPSSVFPHPKPRFSYLAESAHTQPCFGRERESTHKLGATNGNAKANRLRKQTTAATALAAYFGYVSMMYPTTQRISSSVPAP